MGRLAMLWPHILQAGAAGSGRPSNRLSLSYDAILLPGADIVRPALPGIESVRASRYTETHRAVLRRTTVRRGGGVDCESSNPTFTNCTLTGNTVGGGVICRYSSSLTLTNCILWADMPAEILAESSSLVVTCCDVQGSWTGIVNISANPLFVRNPGDGGDLGALGQSCGRALLDDGRQRHAARCTGAAEHRGMA